jgi:hypothetical protein
MTILSATRKRSTRTTTMCNPQKLQKVIDRTMQLRAFNDLLQIRNDNGGALEYGDITKIVTEYNDIGYSCVNRENLRYRMKLLEKKGIAEMMSERITPASSVYLSTSDYGGSSLTNIDADATDAAVLHEPTTHHVVSNSTSSSDDSSNDDDVEPALTKRTIWYPFVAGSRCS